jgi:predicted O-linked N-acetylglucosamine transferase (SPINDLY family)
MNMREQMLTSPLMNAKQFARDVEAAYRQMWKAYTSGIR